MNKQELILSYLKELFAEPQCELSFKNNYELIVAVVLSAQCTDKRVNIVTPKLFEKYSTPYLLANANQEDVIKIIHSLGFYNSKSKNIINLAKDLCERFNGQVPSNFDDLVSLSGVGRKTANVVLSVAYNKQAIAVDTHVFRVSNRLGIKSKSPLECEKKLQKLFNKEDWSQLHYLLVLFGRYRCKAINPQCEVCKLQSICEYYKSNNAANIKKS